MSLIPRFWAIPQDSKGLSAQARILLGVLCTYAMGKNKAWPGQKLLAEEMGVSVRSVQRYVEELEESGWVVKKQRGKKQTNVYTLVDNHVDKCMDKSVVSPHLSTSDTTNLSCHRYDKSVVSIGSNELQEEMSTYPKGMKRASTSKKQELENMNQDIDHTFPRKRLYGNEQINWILDYWEYRMPNPFLEDEKWARIYVQHLKNKIGLGKLKDIIDWLAEPDCWWHSRINGLKMLYYKRDQIAVAMQEKKKKPSNLIDLGPLPE